MAAILIWIVTIAIGLLLVVVTAAMNKLAFHAFVCALISINFAILAMREHERPLAAHHEEIEVLAINARYVGCNWLWMSLAVLAMHLPLRTLNGPTTFALFGFVGALVSLGFARLMLLAAKTHPERVSNLLRIAGMMAFAQLAGAVAILAVLVLSSLGEGSRYDWPSLNVIAFSTVALAIICGRALVTLASGLDAPASAAAVPASQKQPWRATVHG